MEQILGAKYFIIYLSHFYLYDFTFYPYVYMDTVGSLKHLHYSLYFIVFCTDCFQIRQSVNSMAATEAVCIELVMATVLSSRKEISTQGSMTPTLKEEEEEGGTSLPCARRHHGSHHTHTSVNKTGNSQLASSFVTGAPLLKISLSQTEAWPSSL